jgi:hypothetical protein
MGVSKKLLQSSSSSGPTEPQALIVRGSDNILSHDVVLEVIILIFDSLCIFPVDIRYVGTQKVVVVPVSRCGGRRQS